ncbi:MAG: TadE-like protein [Pseudomonadota bacterium]
MRAHKQKGTSTVEFAMILPLLLLLIFTISELGIMFYPCVA